MLHLVLVFASTISVDVSAEDLDKLLVIRSVLSDINSLEEKGVNIGQELKLQLLKNASEISGTNVSSFEKLKEITGNADPPPTPWQRFAGLMTFANIATIIAASIFTVAITVLFGHYFLNLILSVPAVIWELVLYSLCTASIFAGSYVSSDYLLMTILPGTIGILGCIYLSEECHFKHKRKHLGDIASDFFTTIECIVVTLVWSIIAIVYQSETVGFMAVIALMSSFGFIFGIFPGKGLDGHGLCSFYQQFVISQLVT